MRKYKAVLEQGMWSRKGIDEGVTLKLRCKDEELAVHIMGEENSKQKNRHRKTLQEEKPSLSEELKGGLQCWHFDWWWCET